MIDKSKELEVDEIDGKGYGVLAKEYITCNEYVCEYKYNLSYPRSEREKWEQEYAINDEGCYILEVQLPTGKWLCMDATRNEKSFGRYINHARRTEANIRMHSPLLIRGKWRVAMYSTRNIEPGDELAYDYGDQLHKPPFMRIHKVYRLVTIHCN